MAVKKTAAKAAPKEAPAEKAEQPEFKYGIQDLADALESTPPLVRNRLRSAGIEKNGSRYGWNTQAELNAVIKELNSRTRGRPAKSDDDDGDEDEAPKAKKGAKAAAPAPAAKKGAKKKAA